MKDRCEDEIKLRRTSRQGVGRPKKAAEPEPPRIPRVARLMALAIKFQEMIDHGEVKDHADLARLGFVTRARLTQIMNLTLLAPDIQEQILRGAVAHESSIRLVVRWVDWASQRQIWRSASVKTSNLA